MTQFIEISMSIDREHMYDRGPVPCGVGPGVVRVTVNSKQANTREEALALLGACAETIPDGRSPAEALDLICGAHYPGEITQPMYYSAPAT